ncbi:hypothetical protein [Methylobacterium sp. J-076]|uniref:hypothetical protein n=1 Tax=Methylobacterium sp. J-076 TaxID=2836655 RepID=UPI001FBBD64E|nr:hypothetical protein [Methylobacterium sp. J-076]MCJ2015043.1 hypothetical protein [Methylobacterium sp. J-076]
MHSQAIDDDGEGGTGRGFAAIGLPVRFAAAAATVAGLALLARVPPSPELAPTLQRAAGAPAVVGPAPLRLAEPGIDPVRVEPGRIDPKTGLREDVLGRGSFSAIEAPVLRLALTRGIGAERAPGLFVLVARRAALAARGDLPLSVLRTGPRGVVASRFGPVETAEMTLAGPLTRTCTGFVVAQAGLRIDGFLCAPLGGPAEPRALACTLDALDLDDQGDLTTTAQFRQSRSRSACDAAGAASADPAGRTGSIERRRPSTKN